MLTTLLLSFGIPLLHGGDEIGRTQRGNNNAHCQDNPLTWFDWAGADQDLLAFTRRLVALRRSHPVFRRRRFLVGVDAGQLQWFTPAGTPMSADACADPAARCISIYLDGDDAPDHDDAGRVLVDDDFLVLVNGWWEPLDFTLPDLGGRHTWVAELNTFDCTVGSGPTAGIRVGPQSITVLRSPTAAAAALSTRAMP
jgi:isoamylase